MKHIKAKYFLIKDYSVSESHHLHGEEDRIKSKLVYVSTSLSDVPPHNPLCSM